MQERKKMKIIYFSSNVEKVLPNKLCLEDYINYKEMMSFYSKSSPIIIPLSWQLSRES